MTQVTAFVRKNSCLDASFLYIMRESCLTHSLNPTTSSEAFSLWNDSKNQLFVIHEDHTRGFRSLFQAPFFLSNRHFHRSLLLDTCKAAMLNHHNVPKNYPYKTLQAKWKQNKFAVCGHKKVHSCCSRTLLTDVLQQR